MKKPHAIFVYGSLLSRSYNPAETMAGAYVLGPATTKGALYSICSFPGYLPVGPDGEEHTVTGEIVLVDDRGLETLDRYEGVPSLYRREEVMAFHEVGGYVPVWIYVYNDEPSPENFIPHGDFIKYCEEEKAQLLLSAFETED